MPKVRTAAYVKFNRRMQDWAVVGVAAAIAGSGVRIAITGVGSRPTRATAAEQAWNGSNPVQAALLAGKRADPSLGHRRIGRIPRALGERAHPAGARGGGGRALS